MDQRQRKYFPLQSTCLRSDEASQESSLKYRLTISYQTRSNTPNFSSSRSKSTSSLTGSHNTMANNNENKKEKALEHLRSIIRPELNVEKHADFIFAPSHSKNLRQPRKKMWVTELPNGTKASSYLLLEPIYGGKTPSTKTRKVYLTLVKLWEERRRQDDTVVFSAREIADTIGLKWAGKRIAKEIYREIQTLRVCAFTWKYSFFDSHGNKVELLDHINILDKFAYVAMEDRTKPSEKFQALNAVRFSEAILTNLKANRTKPTYFETILSIKGEIASVIYTRLDIILADKPQ